MSLLRAVLVIAVAACGCSVGAIAADKAENDQNASLTSISAAERFKALSPDAPIVVAGERMTKREYLARRARSRAEMVKKIIDLQAESQGLRETKRTAFRAAERAKLEEANGVAGAAAKEMRERELAGRAPDYDERLRQGMELLRRAEKASANEIASMQMPAIEILKSVDPEAAKKAAR